MSGRKPTIAVAIVFALFATIGAAASAPSIWRTVTYDSDAEPSFLCPAGLLSEFVLEKGEKINDGLNSEASAWEAHAIYSGDGRTSILTPHVTFKPPLANARINVLVTTDRRTYRFEITAADESAPQCFVKFKYLGAPTPKPSPTPQLDAYTDSELARLRAAAAAPPIVPPPDPTLIENICPSLTQYGSTAAIAAFKVKLACNDGVRTYVQLSALPIVLPILTISAGNMDATCNCTFDPDLLRYVIVGVPQRFSLKLGSGATEQRMSFELRRTP